MPKIVSEGGLILFLSKVFLFITMSSKRPTAPAPGGHSFLGQTLKLGLSLPKICIQLYAKFQNLAHKTVILIKADINSMESLCISLQTQKRLRNTKRATRAPRCSAFFGDYNYREVYYRTVEGTSTVFESFYSFFQGYILSSH